jgi:hypothetical protein
MAIRTIHKAGADRRHGRGVCGDHSVIIAAINGLDDMMVWRSWRSRSTCRGDDKRGNLKFYCARTCGMWTDSILAQSYTPMRCCTGLMSSQPTKAPDARRRPDRTRHGDQLFQQHAGLVEGIESKPDHAMALVVWRVEQPLK